MRRLVVTGVGGFVGAHLAREAAAAGWSVFGIGRSDTAPTGLDAVLDGYAGVDLRERWPDTAPRDAAVVHLAGLSAVGPSFTRPQEYLSGNSAMVTVLCEAALRPGGGGRIVVVSSGAVYDASAGEADLDESASLGMSSPYAVSKVLVENQVAYYRARGADAVVARPFNHFGPGQGAGFLVPDLARQLADVHDGTPLIVGNLDTRRDYSDVRDVARAYLSLAAAPSLSYDTYNVASGVARSGREVLAAICAALDIDEPPLHVDPSRIRPTDPISIRGDATRLRAETGWHPAVSFEQSIADAVVAEPATTARRRVGFVLQ
ncbi:GDP-4-dehydro-6-deoxy-D-mannose reductase [Microbacterium proteolyticum]|uniref:GDP-4-dehydro-6-deoxy-D-mannose reductase n=1 Tax=Microbacterium proteolyticum TaxID=1572644 RepID=A0A7W5GGG0_9MICO|nr:GDP-4-dehydro-6-deoxy-D-mannose reductase [Microbacterium proteolyticum]